MPTRFTRSLGAAVPAAVALLLAAAGAAAGEAMPLRARLDAPLVFVKRHSYVGIHIYDTYYKWKPGGGIYVLENPADPPAAHRVRPVIDPGTPETLGEGIYSHPELSWDATRLLFCFKGEEKGCTSIYEIGVEGRGLRRVTNPEPLCAAYAGFFGSGVHDIAPAYLPDGRIVFLSTRPSGLVPCFNSGVAILHVMNADGSDLHPISVNNVNEFDPAVLPDGRILFGRWEYIDKGALTQQSLWTVLPDGTHETALYANNMVHPEALLDARPVPGSADLVAATLAPHNSPPRGSVAVVNPLVGKNAPEAIANFEHPDQPTHDRGDSCEPWPLSPDLLVFSGRPPGSPFNVIEMIDRAGRRETVLADPAICLHSPMLVKPRSVPPVLPTLTDRRQTAGRFVLQNIYDGLPGVRPGEVQALRVLEETSRTSPTPGGAMNQTFLMSGVLAWSAKNVLGVVPVAPDGSASFEAPSGRALYFQALDADGRLVQSMRTFVQAAPGATRSCIGCHEHKFTSPPNAGLREALAREPDRPRPESWGSGFIDYPGMVQPILDRRCARCHGGEEGFAGGLDLTGGWTEYFNISYENLASRRRTQLVADLIAGIDCMNATACWSARIFAPREHGSGAARLAHVLLTSHRERVPGLTRAERDLVFAWIDTNGLYHGTWDYSPHGCQVKAWNQVKSALVARMQAAGCARCHGEAGRITLFDGDWFNLRDPELSRILRAPLAPGDRGRGQALCRDRPVDPARWRVRILADGTYHHATRPQEAWPVRDPPPPPAPGDPVVTFASADDPRYQAMLAVIREGRRAALAAPRQDMPGAKVVGGTFRQFVPVPLPEPLPALASSVDGDGVVHLAWERSARTVGLSAEVHRSARADADLAEETLLGRTTRFQFTDDDAPPGRLHYALVLVSHDRRSPPVRATVTVPPPAPPPAPTLLTAAPGPGRVDLAWQAPPDEGLRFHVYRVPAAGGEAARRLTREPDPLARFTDVPPAGGTAYAYTVRAISRRGVEGPPAGPVTAVALPEMREPVFAAPFAERPDALLAGGGVAPGKVHGQARVAGGALDLTQAGHVTFAHRPEFDLAGRISVECSVRLDAAGQMPVIVSCGAWNQAGWFLQRIGGKWRWHVAGIDCDGGRPQPERWVHLVATFDGETARLFEDGRLVAAKAGAPIAAPFAGPLHVGQYSGGPGPAYQVTGAVRSVKVYARALTADDAAAAFKAGRP